MPHGQWQSIQNEIFEFTIALAVMLLGYLGLPKTSKTALYMKAKSEA